MKIFHAYNLRKINAGGGVDFNAWNAKCGTICRPLRVNVRDKRNVVKRKRPRYNYFYQPHNRRETTNSRLSKARRCALIIPTVGGCALSDAHDEGMWSIAVDTRRLYVKLTTIRKWCFLWSATSLIRKKKKKQINLGLIIYITDMPSTTLTLILYIERITYN